MSILFLLGILCFSIGSLCFYIPLRNLKRKIARLVTASIDSSMIKTQLDITTQLQNYITQFENKIKNQSEQISFLKKKIDNITAITQEAIIILDDQGKLLFHNPQSRDVFYLEEHKKTHYLNAIVRSPDVIDIFKQCLNTNQIIKKECVFRKKNQYLISNFQVTAVPINHKEFKNVICFFYDQTNIKESQQAHIDFVSNVSHELKTPLTSIHGYVEMLIHDLSQKKFDQFKNFLQVLLRNCKRMSNLVNDLLSLSNLASQTYLEKKRLSTKEITSQVIEQGESFDHKLHFFFSAPYVMANPRWVEIVLYNLVDNACRHTPAECDVYIRWEKMKDRVVLKVIDSGEGIPEKYRHRIFERFFRIDSARSRKKGGTGVGLSLVKQSMEKHGGCVRAIPSASGGTEFICEFPNA